MVDFGDDFEGQGKTDDIPEVVDEMTKTSKFSRRNFVEHVPNPHGGPDPFVCLKKETRSFEILDIPN